MGANPMQKKARNSFLLGVVITLIICLIIGGVFYFLFVSKNKQREEEEGVLTYVYRLNDNVKSGETISTAKVESILVTSKVVPEGAFSSRIKRTNEKGKEEWIDNPFPAVYKSKVDLKAGTVLSADLLYLEEPTADDLRYIELNMLVLPTTVNIGSYIDIRLTLPSGQDLIVVSHKEVKTLLGDTLGLELTEEEILMIENAIVEAYIMPASKLHAIQYVEPGMQAAAIPTYVQNPAVHQLILENDNIVGEAKDKLAKRYKKGEDGYLTPDGEIRGWINSEVSKYSTERQENIEAGLKEEIENAKAAREAYLSGLTSY